MIRRQSLALTTDASGAGTVTSQRPIEGYIIEVRDNGTALTTGGSADFTITRNDDGGTILSTTNQAAGTWQIQPRAATNSTTGGTTAYGAGQGPVLDPRGVPCVGHVKIVVAQGALSASGTVHIIYDDCL